MSDILFFGTYQRKVDTNGRVSIPTKWRKSLNGYVFIFENEFTNFCYKDLKRLTKNDLQHVNKYVIDKKGRITLNHKMLKIMMFRGYGDYFTIEFSEPFDWPF